MSDDHERRHARSEAARQASLAARRAELRKQQESIRASLQSIDSAKPRVKRLDTSSDDDDDKTESTAVRAQSTGRRERGTTNRVQLFDDDDDDGESPDAQLESTLEMKIKNRHHGKSGEKLMKMESRFGNDTRFRLDERFVDEETDPEDGLATENSHGEGAPAPSTSNEKQTIMRALARVLHKDVDHVEDSVSRRHVIKKDASSGLPPRPFTRFDPSNPVHVEWMQRFEAQKKSAEEPSAKHQNKAKAVEPPSEPVQKVVKRARQEAKLDEGFADALRRKQAEGKGVVQRDVSEDANADDAPFSFLGMMGHAEKADGLSTVEPTIVTEKSNGDVAPEKKKERVGTVPSTYELNEAPTSYTQGRFFISLEDDYVRSVVSNFKRTQPMEKVKAAWEAARPYLVKVYKHQKRHARAQERDAERRRYEGAAARRQQQQQKSSATNGTDDPSGA